MAMIVTRRSADCIARLSERLGAVVGVLGQMQGELSEFAHRDWEGFQVHTSHVVMELVDCMPRIRTPTTRGEAAECFQACSRAMYRCIAEPQTPWLRFVARVSSYVDGELRADRVGGSDELTRCAWAKCQHVDVLVPDGSDATLTLADHRRARYEQVALGVARLRAASGASGVVDVGSGKGHMSEALSRVHGVPCCAVDSTERLLAQGAAAYAKGPQRQQGQRSAATVRRVRASLSVGTLREGLRSGSLRPDVGHSVVAGLHCCGHLSDVVISAAIDAGAPGALVVPCCPHLLEFEPTHRTARRESAPSDKQPGAPKQRRLAEYPARSRLGASLGLGDVVTGSALYTANLRAVASEDDFAKLAWLQALRFGWVLLGEETELRDAVNVDAAHARVRGRRTGQLRTVHDTAPSASFATYARACAAKVGGSIVAPDSDLDDFFEAPATQRRILELVAAKACVDRLGRIVEAALLWDRAAQLAEAGFDAIACDVLDPATNSRPLGIIARRDHHWLLS